jgi:hypothetical protein
MLSLTTSPTYRAERAYITRVVAAELLGLEEPVTLRADGAPGSWQLHLPGGARITMPDVFFGRPEAAFGTAALMPELPLHRTVIAPPFADHLLHPRDLPVLFGAPDAPQVRAAARNIELGIDILGAAFFMLTRYEELVDTRLDAHGRRRADHSVAAQAGFLEFPLVNEYVELLRNCLNALCPGLAPRRRAYRLVLTHDVDRTTLNASLHAFARGVAGDLLKRRDPTLLSARARSLLRGDAAGDPVDRFAWLMDLSEAHGLTSEFYFIPRNLAGALDGTYDLADPFVRRLIAEVHRRGHVVGLHPSYRTFGNPVRLQEEVALLRRTCEDLGVPASRLGGRQHYLRWSPDTWRDWADAGLAYDSSVGYSERPGFRTGSCVEYTTWDLRARRPLALTERPLIVMEGTLIEYQRLGWERVGARIRELAATCAHYGGDFVLLWHNSSLARAVERETYRGALAAIAPARGGVAAEPARGTA